MKIETFLADFTFKTNHHDLLLGAVGPAGLNLEGPKLPSMRFLPQFFVLAGKEDATSIQLAINIYLDWAKGAGVEVTDGCF